MTYIFELCLGFINLESTFYLMHSCLTCGCKLTKRYHNYYCSICKTKAQSGNPRKDFKIGLTSFVNGRNGQRCKKCDIPLSNSTWEDILVVHRNTKKPMSNFYCLTCLRNAEMKCYKTEKEIEDFVKLKMMVSN